MPDIKFSIVICTHNRVELARNAIDSVINQDFPQNEFELLIIDNASTDGTCKMAQEFCNKYSNVSYILETTVGVSYARNRGWREARGEFVGYLDDECISPREWLSSAEDVVLHQKPAAFGGPYFAFYNTSKPHWFKDEYESNVLAAHAYPLSEKEFLTGANMFIRRDLLVTLNGFSLEFGMVGKKIAYGEETHFFKRLVTQFPNALIYYDPRVFVHHLVRPEKMKLSTIPNRFFNHGRAYIRIFPPRNKPTVWGTIKNILWLSSRMVSAGTWGIITRNRLEFPHKENYIYEKCYRKFAELGMFFQTLIQLRFQMSEHINSNDPIMNDQ